MPNVVSDVPFFVFPSLYILRIPFLFVCFPLYILVSVIIISIPTAVLGRFYPAAQVKPNL